MHDFDGVPERPAAAPLPLPFERAFAGLNRVIVIFAGAALLVASCILTYSVVVRYYLRIPTDWQDEASVFLLIGATFLSCAWVQSERRHIGIGAVAALLSAKADAIRLVLVDLASFAFCAFFCAQCWSLLHEAIVEDHHAQSSWGPPLWIPYSTMAVGMSLLCLQIAFQLAHYFRFGKRA